MRISIIVIQHKDYSFLRNMMQVAEIQNRYGCE